MTGQTPEPWFRIGRRGGSQVFKPVSWKAYAAVAVLIAVLIGVGIAGHALGWSTGIDFIAALVAGGAIVLLINRHSVRD